jgi:hypothetical protein
MKTMSRFWQYMAPVIVVLAGEYTVSGISGQNLLADPGFESGTPVASGMGGWAELNGSIFSQSYSHSGLWSLEDQYNSGAVGPVVGGFQILPASAGSVFDVSGWGFAPATLSTSGQGLLLADFLDSSQHLINSGGNDFYEIGLLDSSTPAQNWNFLSGSVTAPDGTAYIQVIPELYNGSPGDAVYYDDLSLTLVPEPSTMIVLGMALAFLLVCRRGRIRPIQPSAPPKSC